MKHIISLSIVILMSSFTETKDDKIEWNENVKYKVNGSTNDSHAVTPFSTIIKYQIKDSFIVFDSHCMVNKKTICQYPVYTTKDDFVKCLIVLGKYKEICCRNVKKKMLEDYLVIDKIKVEEVFLSKEEELNYAINNENFSVKNIIKSNMDSLNDVLNNQLKETDRYKSMIKIRTL